MTYWHSPGKSDCRSAALPNKSSAKIAESDFLPSPQFFGRKTCLVLAARWGDCPPHLQEEPAESRRHGSYTGSAASAQQKQCRGGKADMNPYGLSGCNSNTAALASIRVAIYAPVGYGGDLSSITTATTVTTARLTETALLSAAWPNGVSACVTPNPRHGGLAWGWLLPWQRWKQRHVHNTQGRKKNSIKQQNQLRFKHSCFPQVRGTKGLLFAQVFTKK